MPTTDQATDDQLATLYLRDRDTPCPNCNYNRRDGTTSTCPECNHPFILVGIDTQEHTRYTRLAKSILLITGLYALVFLVRYLLSIKLLIGIANGSVGITDSISYIINWSIALIVAIVALILALIAWRKTRRGVNLSVATITLPIKLIVVHFLLVSIYYSIRSFF